MTLKQSLASRRSVRSFSGKDIADDVLLEILWAGQGVTSDKGYRTAPSAGATYPLELHVVKKDGVFRYEPSANRLALLVPDNRLGALSKAALNQGWVDAAAANIVIAGVVSRTAARYGDRAPRYVDIEAGCAAQNMMLMATASGLGSVLVGAYDDGAVRESAALPENSVPLAIISVGVLSR